MLHLYIITDLIKNKFKVIVVNIQPCLLSCLKSSCTGFSAV